MTTLINDGWLVLTNGVDEMKLACERIEISEKRQPTMNILPGGVNVGYDLGISQFTFNVSNIYFKSRTDLETFLEKIRLWQYSGTLTLKVIIDSSGNLIKYNGTDTSTRVLYTNLSFTKLTPGDGQYYRVKKIMLYEVS